MCNGRRQSLSLQFMMFILFHEASSEILHHIERATKQSAVAPKADRLAFSVGSREYVLASMEKDN